MVQYILSDKNFLYITVEKGVIHIKYQTKTTVIQALYLSAGLIMSHRIKLSNLQYMIALLFTEHKLNNSVCIAC